MIFTNRKNFNKVIIFDMDNTLLKSEIDFKEMKREVCSVLESSGIKPDEAQPVAQIIQSSRQAEKYTPQIEEALWQKVNQVEAKGMGKAVLEPGIIEVLERLYQKAGLMLLSNNLHSNIEKVLKTWKLEKYFMATAGRGKIEELKPLPHGYLYLMAILPDLKREDFLAIGDASIDLLAANTAGIPFIAYNNSRKEDWSKFDNKPLAYLESWNDQSCEVIEELLLGQEF